MKTAAILTGIALAVTASAQTRAYLNIGDPAPELNPARWLKGSAIPHFEKGKVYVVEFWATWCGPCKENIPHLTELAKKYKDVAISGISIWESNDPKSTAYLAKVDKFVKAQGPKMDYHVAVDGPDAKVANAWMKAADESGIPMTFVVGKDGRIAWMGHPTNLEEVLAQVTADKFDVQAARDRRATEVEFTRPIREAMANKTYDKALDLIDKQIAKKPENARYYTYDRLVALYHVNPDKAIESSKQVLEESNNDIGAYRMIASIFASQKDLSESTYRYGKTLIAEALKKEEMKYLFLAMSAEVSASLGDYAEAVSAQTEAVATAEKDPHAPADFVEFLRKNLAGFKAKLKS